MGLSDLLLRLAALWGQQQMKKWELNQRLKYQKELMRLQDEIRQRALSQQSLQKRINNMVVALIKSGKVTTPQDLYQYVLSQTGDPVYAKEIVSQYSWMLDIAKQQQTTNEITTKFVNYYNSIINYTTLSAKYYNQYLRLAYSQPKVNTNDQMVLTALSQLFGQGDVDTNTLQQQMALSQQNEQRDKLAKYYYERAKDYWLKAKSLFEIARAEWMQLPDTLKTQVALQTRGRIDLSIFDSDFDSNPLFHIDPMNFGITDTSQAQQEQQQSTEPTVVTNQPQYTPITLPPEQPSAEQKEEQLQPEVSEPNYPYTAPAAKEVEIPYPLGTQESFIDKLKKGWEYIKSKLQPQRKKKTKRTKQEIPQIQIPQTLQYAPPSIPATPENTLIPSLDEIYDKWYYIRGGW